MLTLLMQTQPRGGRGGEGRGRLGLGLSISVPQLGPEPTLHRPASPAISALLSRRHHQPRVASGHCHRSAAVDGALWASSACWVP